MSTIRTPSAIYAANVYFYSTGETLDQTKINRPLHQLDDKAEYLKVNHETLQAQTQALASVLGESLTSSISNPTWGSTNYIAATDDYHTVIEKLDAAIATAVASTDVTRLNNLDSLLGETSASATTPTWGGLGAVVVIQSGDDHHTAIERLDQRFAVVDATTSDHEARISVLESTLGSTVSQLATAENAISVNQTDISTLENTVSVLQTEVDAVSVLTNTNATNVSTLTTSATSISTLAAELSCVQEKVKSQINELRSDHSRASIVTWCP